MVFSDINKIVNSALGKLILKDKYLLINNVHEQTITSKLACYIGEELCLSIGEFWDVDTEYNRNGKNPKSLRNIGNVKPDIIIHRRGKNNNRNFENNNLLIIEVKKNPKKDYKQNDLKKIMAFIDEHPFYYKYGVFIGLKIVDEKITYDLDWKKREV